MCEPDWDLLIAELGETYLNQVNIVSVISSVVQVWFDTMNGLLDGGAPDDWIDMLLEKFKAANSRLSVFVDVSYFWISIAISWQGTHGISSITAQIMDILILHRIFFFLVNGDLLLIIITDS